MNQTIEFLNILWGEKPPPGYFIVWTLKDKTSRSFPSDSLAQVPGIVESISSHTDVFYGVGLQENPQEPNQRGRSFEVSAIPGFYFDFDVQGPGHKKTALPQSKEEVEAFLEALPWKPTLTVSSGGGIHAYWLFHEPWVFTPTEGRSKAIVMSKAFQDKIYSIGKQHGWDLDITADLARCLRLPGTYNHKNAPVPVEIMGYVKERRYHPEDFGGLPPKTPSLVMADSIIEGERNSKLASLAGSMKAKGMSQEAVIAALLQENLVKCSPPLDENEVRQIVKSIFNYKPEKHFKLTDMGNAERLIHKFGNELKFCENMGSWLFYDGIRWVLNSENGVTQRAKIAIREISVEAASIDDEEYRKRLSAHANQSESYIKIRDMVSLAKTDPKIAVKVEDLDRDPFLLNCKNGTLNLGTMDFMSHDPSDLITKCADVDYDPSAQCPRFLSFIGEIMDGNPKLINYLAQVFGYALTGDNGEQCFFIFYGEGQNGKSTLLKVFKEILGDYAKTTDFQTLTYDGNGIRNDLARLAGARMVTSVEADDKKFLNQSVINRITGNDPIAVRFLQKEYFEYTPKFKLIVASNDRPRIEKMNYATWRRIQIVPFAVRIAEDKRINGLEKMLLKESSGILNWAVQGYRMLRLCGLQKPREVISAIEDYKEEMDNLSEFFEECCDVDGCRKIKASDFNRLYEDWCSRSGVQFMGIKKFKAALIERGYKLKKTGGSDHWIGLGMKENDQDLT